jgi:hypothetical protein
MRCPNFPLILAHLNRLLFGSQIRKNGLFILDLLAIAWIQRFFASKTLNLLGNRFLCVLFNPYQLRKYSLEMDVSHSGSQFCLTLDDIHFAVCAIGKTYLYSD